MVIVPIPYALRFKATVSGTTRKRVTCFSCQASYEFDITRQVNGEGVSALFLDNKGAKKRAVRNARENLDEVLKRSQDPVPCPVCGMYQPSMVEILRRKRGRRYDPNLYARQRAGTTDRAAWKKALSENTLEAYQAFIQIWPHSPLTIEAQVKVWKTEGRKREEEWTPATGMRSIIVRVVFAAAAFGCLFLLSWKFGRY